MLPQQVRTSLAVLKMQVPIRTWSICYVTMSFARLARWFYSHSQRQQGLSFDCPPSSIAACHVTPIEIATFHPRLAGDLANLMLHVRPVSFRVWYGRLMASDWRLAYRETERVISWWNLPWATKLVVST